MISNNQYEFSIDGKSIIPHKFEIKIYPDDCPDDPRTWDNLGIAVIESERASREIISNESEKLDESVAYYRFPISIYDHSGVRIWIGMPNDPWDSCVIGHYHVPSEGRTQEEARKIAELEISTYDQYINGAVFGYEITMDGEPYDSMYGFFGDDADEIAEQMMGYISAETGLTAENVVEAIRAL
jgi:hypothetical protein